jgi:hypothetical protein
MRKGRLDNIATIEGDGLLANYGGHGQCGATVLDQPVVVDESVVTGRFIYDIPQFVDAIDAQLN